MNRIVSKRRLSENVYRMDVEAPLVARNRKAGQFVIVMVDAEYGERIPLTIADADPERGTVTLVFQSVGATTMKLAALNAGDDLPALLGPLGHPTRIAPSASSNVLPLSSAAAAPASSTVLPLSSAAAAPASSTVLPLSSAAAAPASSTVLPLSSAAAAPAVRRVVCVGGGIGVAPLHPIAQALKAAGCEVTVIMGARTAALFVMEEEMRRIAGERLIRVTDDGSAGRKGLVTEPLKELCEAGSVDEVIAIGPPVMMKFCAKTTEPFGVKTTVSLNTVMIDGTGMCGGCRVTVGGETKFVCVDGPEFDGHQVDWDQMLSRMSAFKPQEIAAKDHLCNLLKLA